MGNNTHVVLKKLPGANGDIKPGTKVDASEWRNAPLLVAQRYLKPLDGVEDPSDLASPEAIDLRAKVTEIILADLRENGPIAHALKGVEIGSPPQTAEDASTQQRKTKRAL